MTRSQKSQDGGFVLLSALVAVGVLSLLGATIASMAITSKNAEEKWVLRDRSASLAQSGLEKTRWGIYEKFYEYYNASPNAQMPSKFKWFETVSENSIGTAGYEYTIPQGATFTDESGGTPTLWADGRYTATLTPYMRNDSRWDVLISVEANFIDSNGTVLSASTRTIEEMVTYTRDSSDVFGYAYFVNNHGWFYGSSITANGPVRSNGDFHLKYGPTVNGDVYASVNTDNGSTGVIYGDDYVNDSINSYNSDSSLSAWARPAIPDSYKVKNNHGHGNNIDGVDASNPGASKEGEDTDPTIDDEKKGSTAIYEPLMMTGYDDDTKKYEGEKQLKMPTMGDLTGYKNMAKDQGGTIEVWNESTSAYEVVTTDGTYAGNGPDGVEGTADDGVLVLVGDAEHPIKLNGPVVAENDVIIRGVYTGQGTVYSGRNVHVVGNVVAANNPSWPRDTATSEANVEANNAKDIICLAAKGNVMLGDVNEIADSYYMKPPFTRPYTPESTDSDIGYAPNSGTQWDGDYTAEDGGVRVSTGEITGDVSVTSNSATVTGRGTTFSSSLSAGDMVRIDGKVYTVSSIESDTSLTLSRNASSSASGVTVETKKTTAEARRYYESSVSEIDFQNLLQKDSYGNVEQITQVDAVTYTNHLCAGDIGEATFNGSIVSRDEAILFDGSLNINWDLRAVSDAEGNMAGISLPRQLRKPSTIYWRER